MVVCPIKVLKYSEDDLPEILVAARRAQRDTETEMVRVQEFNPQCMHEGCLYF